MMIWPIRCKGIGVRSLIFALLIPLLAACQTVPPAPSGPFSAQQVALLQSYNFVEVDDNWELGLQGKLLFPFDGSNLVPEQAASIKLMAEALLKVGITGCRVEGHTDSIGREQYNHQLSLRRAQAVKDALVSGGIQDANVEALGKGASQPIEDNDTPEGRQENRRVVIIVTPENSFPF